MRLRTLLLVLAAAAVVAFTLMNWNQFTQPETVNLGWRTASVPLPLLLLGLLVLTTVAWLADAAVTSARSRRLEREQSKALQAQRELADRAEASRLTELRQALDTHLRETRQRESVASAQADQAAGRIQRELRGQLEMLHRAMGTRLGEMEARLDTRLARMEPALASALRPPAVRHEEVETPGLGAQEPVRLR